jgi:tryptophanyl-tRNA synthetase
VGIDPEKSVICVQSRLPALAELTMLYMNYVTVSRLERNPTVKQEIVQRGFSATFPPASFAIPSRKRQTSRHLRPRWSPSGKTSSR